MQIKLLHLTLDKCAGYAHIIAVGLAHLDHDRISREPGKQLTLYTGFVDKLNDSDLILGHKLRSSWFR